MIYLISVSDIGTYPYEISCDVVGSGMEDCDCSIYLALSTTAKWSDGQASMAAMSSSGASSDSMIGHMLRGGTGLESSILAIMVRTVA